MKRIESIDTTRGIVMVLMALDHVRDFMHKTSMNLDPTDLKTTSSALFFTRWVTHLCAPTFVFLSGLSAYLSVKDKNNMSESRKILLTRGIWLLVLEFTLVNFALWFDIHFRLMLMEVISAIGLSFIVLSLLLKLPSRVIGATGIIIIFSHNLLQFINLPSNPALQFLSSVIYRPALTQITPDFAFFTAYPLLPWLGIMLAGFGCGEFFDMTYEKRKKALLLTGVGILTLFVLIRFTNLYGEPSLWSAQKSAWFSVLSFVNVTKYPPSLLFSLLFLGIMFVILFISEKSNNRVTRVLSVYGRVPLFYFIIHLYIIHLLMLVMIFIQGFRTDEFLFGAFNNGRPKATEGVNLLLVYLIWAGVVGSLYPVCRWYGKYKSEHKNIKFLRYL